MEGTIEQRCTVYDQALTEIQLLTATDIPYIRGIPEIPGALPVVGHLLGLGDDHATVCEKWWKKHKVRSQK